MRPMHSFAIYRHLADAVLVLHVGVVFFIVGGLLAVLAGGWLGWRWVRNFSFRLLHLAAIVYVAGQSWFAVACPLTVLESWLRMQAHQPVYERGFIEDWLQRALYFNAPAWVFVLAYSLFAGLVALSWVWYPPSKTAYG